MDTPETDKAERMAYAGEYMVPTDFARRLERERDEARAELADWQDSAKNVRKEYEDEQHCSCVPILRKLLKDAERERDEARELAEAYKEYAQVLGVEINDMVIHAHVHGLKFSRFEQSKVLHEKIKQLEAAK